MMIGIDLGTTNSMIAYWDGECANIIPNALGEPHTPSVVSIDEDGSVLVGSAARERLITHPQKTAAGFKRYMGTKKVFNLGEHCFTPTDLSHFVLKSLKQDAENFLGVPITEAVISIPAYFHDNQRQATKQAAQLAGLNVERLITEPTAAALAYGLHGDNAPASFMVLDLGGGTFDVSVLEWFDGVMEVRAVAGDNRLGGDDFDTALTSLFCHRLGLGLEEISSKLSGVLCRQAERARIMLSDNDTADISFRYEEKAYKLSVSRKDTAPIFEPLYRRLHQPIERVMQDLRLSAGQLDAVVLVGGATRMPSIRSMVAKLFNRFPYSNLDPDKTVALGAAIQAALVAQDDTLKEVVMTDVCPFTLGVDTCNTNKDGKVVETGIFSPIIERNSTVPLSKLQRYYALYPGQAAMRFRIYQGEQRKVENNVMIGEIEIPLPTEGDAAQCADIRFTYDINGLLEVEVIVPSTGLIKKLVIEQAPGAMTPEEIERRFSELSELKIHPRDKTENRLLLARGERLYEASIRERRLAIEGALARLAAVFESQNEHIIRQTVSEIKDFFDQLEHDAR